MVVYIRVVQAETKNHFAESACNLITIIRPIITYSLISPIRIKINILNQYFPVPTYLGIFPGMTKCLHGRIRKKHKWIQWRLVVNSEWEI